MIYKFREYIPKIHKTCFVADSADVIGDVIIEKDANIWFSTVIRGDENSICIGKGTNIQDNCTVHNAKKFPTNIGKYVTVGHNAIIHACKIGDYSLIGMGTTILNGAEIGEYTIIGAGSLVTQSAKIPSGVLAFGSPAKVIRKLTQEEKDFLVQSAYNYISYAKEYKKMC